MLKKYFFVGVVLCSFPLLAEAKLPYGMAGCGLGSMAIAPDGNQVFASTINQTSYQSFAISSGTSNCLETTKAAAFSAQQEFITTNFSILSKEIAQGDGEALKAFSNTFGCPKNSYSSFATQMQSSYSKIFAAPGSMAALDIIESTTTILKNKLTFRAVYHYFFLFWI